MSERKGAGWEHHPVRPMGSGLEQVPPQDERAREALVHEVETLRAQVLELERLAGLGLLLSGVAHEINNLLTGAIGFAYLLGRQVGGTEAPERRMLTSISTELNRCAVLTRSLVHYASAQRTTRQIVDLSALVVRVAERMRPTFGAKGIDFRLQVAGTGMIKGTHVQLEAVVRGLLLGALDRLGGKGKAEWVVLTVEARAGMVTLELLDSSGAGESPSVLEPLLQPVQGEVPFHLIIAKAVVKDHGGKMELARNAQGLMCTLRFPSLPESQSV